MTALTFSPLLRSSWTLFKQRWLAFIGMWVLMLIITMPLGIVMAMMETAVVNQAANDVGISQETLGDYRSWKNLTENSFFGDMEMPEELRTALIEAEVTPEMLDEALSARESTQFIPVAIAYIIAMALSLIITVAMWIISFPERVPMGVALRRSFQLAPKMIGITVAIIILSFIWVPFVLMLIPGTETIAMFAFLAAIVWCLILFPRWVTIMLVALTQHLSIVDTIRTGYRASSGYWRKILGNMLLLGFIFLGAYIAIVVAAIAVGEVLGDVMMNNLILAGIGIFLLVVAYISLVVIANSLATIFYVQLGLTIMQNPKTKKA